MNTFDLSEALWSMILTGDITSKMEKQRMLLQLSSEMCGKGSCLSKHINLSTEELTDSYAENT